jgi:hypothetical protein
MQAMKVALGVLAVLLLVCGTALAAETLQGKVVSATGDQLTMTDNDGKEHAISVGAATAITLDGQKAKLADLKKGFSVTATGAKEGGKFVATKIEAKST